MPYITRRMAQLRKGNQSSQISEKNIRELPMSMISSYADCSTASRPANDIISVISAADSAASRLQSSAANSSSASAASGSPFSTAGVSKQKSASRNKAASKSKNSRTHLNGSSATALSGRRNGDSNGRESATALSKDANSVVRAKESFTKKPQGLQAWPQDYNKNPEIPLDERQLLFSMQLIKSNLKRINENPGYLPTTDASFGSYTIQKTLNLKSFKPNTCQIALDARHKDHSDTKLICKQYSFKDCIPSKLKYFKILRHMGKKHPSIDGAWEIFASDDTVYMFTELAGYTNLMHLLEEKGCFKETKTQEFTWQIFKAMDFLGDMGISHRRIEPCHVLIYKYSNELMYKLSGFWEAIEYWNPVKEEVILQDCVPQSDDLVPHFQAPEMFGDPTKEVYDPISADVWSFGATIYFSVCKNYPYAFDKQSKTVGEEIQENIRKSFVTKTCQDLLSRMMLIDAAKRISFTAITQHPWLTKI